MIPVEHYKTVYFIILSVLMVVFFLPNMLVKRFGITKSKSNNIFVFVVLFIVIGFIGLRDPWALPKYLGDTIAYSRTFDAIKFGYKTEFTKDVGFYLFMKLCSSFISIRWFYIICAFIYVVLPYIAFKKWFGNLAIYILLVYVVSFSFLPFGINGLRNGLASAIFIYALVFFERKWIMYAIMILSITFHKGLLLPFFAFIMVSFIRNPKIYLSIWLLSIPLSLLFRNSLESLALMIFESDSIIQDTRATGYFSEDADKYKVSGQFRVDFILYSSVAIVLGFWTIVQKGFKNKLYISIYGVYVIANAVWILLIYAPYTNRIAYLSWFIMPIVLATPFLTRLSFTKHNKRNLILLIYGSLAFTLLMEII